MNRVTWAFLIGLFLGSVMVGTAAAAARAVLVNGDGTEIGTAANPLYVN